MAGQGEREEQAMNEASEAGPRRIEAFFSTPAARKDRWRELVDAARAWAAGTDAMQRRH